MPDDPEELRRQLDRIEQLLRQPSELPSRVSAGPDVRSARSIVSRVDDVWVAVTEGNERLVDAIERLRTDIAEFAAAVAALAGVGEPADGGEGTDQGTGGVAWGADGGESEAGPPVANPATGTPGGSEPAVHLRLNRIEEALAGIAGRLDDLASSPADTQLAPANAPLAAALVRLDQWLAAIAGRLDDLTAAAAAETGESPGKGDHESALVRVDESLVAIAGRLAELAAPQRPATMADGAEGEDDHAAAVSRIDVSLSAIAGRLDDLVSAFVHPEGGRDEPAGVGAPSPADALVEHLNAAVRLVGDRLGSLTQALAASATGRGDRAAAAGPSAEPLAGSTPEGARLRLLEPVVPADPGRPELPDDRRAIREVTRQVAFEPDGWSPERAARISALFDGLAPGWHERPGAGRYEALDDALARGGPFPAGPCLEVGSGTGLVSPRLVSRFSPLLTVDLSPGMLALASPMIRRIQADASSLPVPDGAAAVVVLVNMFLFPAEVDRVLAPGGVLVWVNTMGDATPIHLPATDVLAALPGDWEGVAADAGWGTWATLRRASAR